MLQTGSEMLSSRSALAGGSRMLAFEAAALIALVELVGCHGRQNDVSPSPASHWTHAILLITEDTDSPVVFAWLNARQPLVLEPVNDANLDAIARIYREIKENGVCDSKLVEADILVTDGELSAPLSATRRRKIFGILDIKKSHPFVATKAQVRDLVHQFDISADLVCGATPENPSVASQVGDSFTTGAHLR